MKEKVKIETIIYIAFIIVISSITYIKEVIGININYIIPTIIVCLYMLISKKDPMEIFAFIIPFRSTIQYNFILIVAIIKYMLIFKGKINISKNIFLLVFLFLIELFNSINVYSKITDYISFIMIYTTMYLFVQQNKDRINEKNIIRNFLIGIIISSFIFFYKSIKVIPLSIFISSGYRLGTSRILSIGTSDYALNYNANELALFMLLGISIILFLKIKHKINNVGFITFIVYFTFIGFLTSSRSFIIILFLFIIVYLIKNKEKRHRLLFIMLIISSFSIIYFFNSKNTINLLQNYETRFEEKDITGGRLSIFNKYNSFFLSSPRNMIIGNGTQNLSEKTGILHSCHNATQEIFISFGIVGGIIYFMLIYSFYKKMKRKGIKYEIDTYIPALVFIFMIQTIQLVSQGAINQIIIIILIPLLCKEDKRIENYK